LCVICGVWYLALPTHPSFGRYWEWERVHHFSDYLCDSILCEGTQFPNFYYVHLPTLPTVFLALHKVFYNMMIRGGKGRRRAWAWWSKQRWWSKAYLNTFINLLQYGLLTKWLSLKWYYNLYVLVLLILQINWGFGSIQRVSPSPYLSFNFEWWKSTNGVLLIPCQNSNLKWPNVHK
jgi:hypothetical protein